MAASAPACRRCNYLVAGLPTLICPECGGDFRQAGIRVPGEPRTIGIAGALIACTVLVFVPVVIIWMILSGVLEKTTITHSLQYGPIQPQQQTSPIQSFSVTCFGGGSYWNWEPDQPRDPVQTVTFQVTVAGHSPSTLQSDIYGNCLPGDSPPHSLDAQSALAWLAKAGLNPAAAQARQLADDIVASLPQIRAEGVRTVGFADLGCTGQSYSGTGSSIAIQKIPWLFGGLIWVILTWRIWRMRDDLIRGLSVCGRCGCDASRFTNFSCPQCDADSRQHGIRFHERHRWSGRAAPLFILGLLTLVGGAITGGILDHAFWQSNMFCSAFFSSPDNFRHEPIIQYVSISAAATRLQLRNHDYKNFSPDELTLDLKIKGHRPLTAFLEKNGTWHYLANDGTFRERPWTLPALLEMQHSAGLDPADKQTQQLAAEILTGVAQSWAGAVDQIHFAGMFRAGGVTSSSGGDAGWLSRIQWFAWLLIWAVLVWLTLRHKSGTTAASEITSATPNTAVPAPPDSPELHRPHVRSSDRI